MCKGIFSNNSWFGTIVPHPHPLTPPQFSPHYTLNHMVISYFS
jgi:hypothetical protein